MSVTATGRKMIMDTRDYVEGNYPGADVIYGDSVAHDTPILARRTDTGVLRLEMIRDLAGGRRFAPYRAFRPDDAGIDHGSKEQFVPSHAGALPGMQVWTSCGWAYIVRIVRHRARKRVFRVSAWGGTIDVTEDHSLLDTNLCLVRPGDAVRGETRLFCSFPRGLHCSYPSALSPAEARDMGVAVALRDASLSEGRTKRSVRPARVPGEVLNGTMDAKRGFVAGFHSVSGGLVAGSRLLAQGIYVIVGTLCQACSLQPPVVCTIQRGEGRADLFAVISRYLPEGAVERIDAGTWDKVRSQTDVFWGAAEVPYPADEFVYDIETSAGNFHAGVGSLVVKNTDSVFCRFGVGTDMRAAFSVATEAAERITKIFKQPIE